MGFIYKLTRLFKQRVFPIERGFSCLLVACLLVALLLFPVFLFLFKVSSVRLPDSPRWFFVLLSTLSQAGLSAFFSVLLGVAGGLGLCQWAKKPGRKMGMWELICLLPVLLPPLVSVLAWVNVSEWFFRFPFSFTSVVGVHVLMNIGLVSVFFFRLFSAHAGNLPAYAFLHGASRYQLLKTFLFFEFRKDVILIFLLVFSFCFTSFSVPLLIGGVSGQTLEVFIAEKLKTPSAWPEAGALFLIETLFIFLFFILLYGKNNLSALSVDKKNSHLYHLPCSYLWSLPMLSSLLVFCGLWGFLSSSTVWGELFLIKSELLSVWGNTFLMGILTGLCVFVLLCLCAFCLRELFLRKFLTAYAGSSVAFMGFAFLLIGSDAWFVVLLKWSLGLSLLFLPALYRLMGERVVRRLGHQVQVADLMGASRIMVFYRIVLPQCAGVFLFLAGIAAFWACGDFAYSSITSGGWGNLALLIQDLFSSYRFDLASVLTWICILTGGICFSLFAGVGFVLHKKSYL